LSSQEPALENVSLIRLQFGEMKRKIARQDPVGIAEKKDRGITRRTVPRPKARLLGPRRTCKALGQIRPLGVQLVRQGHDGSVPEIHIRSIRSAKCIWKAI
jgi:hypothetical protein